MKVCKTINNGRPVYRISYYKSNKRKFKSFKNKGDAEIWLANYKIALLRGGQEHALSDPALSNQWRELDTELQKLGSSLLEVGEARLVALRSVTKQIELASAVELFLAAKQDEDISPRYYSDLRSRLGQLVRAFGNHVSSETLSKEQITTYIDSVKGGLVSKDNHRRALSVFFNWLKDCGYITLMPVMAKSKASKRAQATHEVSVLTVDETKTLLAQVLLSDNASMDYYVVISLFTGIRSAEFCKDVRINGVRRKAQIYFKDISRAGIKIRSENSKTGKPRVAEMNDVLWEWLEYLKNKYPGFSAPDKPIVGGGYQQIFRKWRDKHNVNYYTPNCMRHSFGSYYTARHGSFGRTAKLMGNSSAIVEKHYWSWETLVEDAKEYFSITPNYISSL